jgi:hypothetical protein
LSEDEYHAALEEDEDVNEGRFAKFTKMVMGIVFSLKGYGIFSGDWAGRHILKREYEKKKREQMKTQEEKERDMAP